MRLLSEDEARTWDTWSKVAAVVIVFIGGLASFLTYYETHEKDRAQAVQAAVTTALEARKPFEAKRLEICIEDTTATATIARNHDKKKVAKAREDFEALYWGPSAVVSDPSVNAAMASFRQCADAGKCGDMSLEQLSDTVAEKCAESLSQSWRVGKPGKLSIVAK